jgi:hypothetical protein
MAKKQKSDKHDAFGLAAQLRIGAIRTKVYNGTAPATRLSQLR